MSMSREWVMERHARSERVPTNIDEFFDNVMAGVEFVFPFPIPVNRESKSKPVIVTRPNPKRKYMAINEILAYHLGITRLLQIEPAKISNEKYDGFIYQFCYHNIDPKQLIPRLELLGAIP